MYCIKNLTYNVKEAKIKIGIQGKTVLKFLFKGLNFMKTIRKPLSVLLFAVMLISVICAAPFNVFAATTHSVSSAEELQAVCNDINLNGGEHVIELEADISGIGAHIEITNSDAVVTVKGNGHTITNSENTVYVEDGATLNLGDGNSTLTFQSGSSNDDPGIIYVLNNGVCNMYDGVTLKDHKGQNYYGGGVTVQDGTFRMYGGTIDNCGIDDGSVCYGGGVAVINGGKFVMDGGTISNCYVHSDLTFDVEPDIRTTAMGGGVFVTAGSSFTMNGGTITGCEADNFGGGAAIVLSFEEKSNYGGFGNLKSTATINGGTISNNTAKNGAGLFTSGYYYAYSPAFHVDPMGIGYTDHPGLCVNGGEISSNEAAEAGGGVLVAMLRSEVKAQIKNAEIKNNTADIGAGIENLRYYTQLDIDGCTITGNEATSNGGGIAALLNSGQGQAGYTKIKDTAITDNTSGGRGAGVYYDADSEIRITGANTIQDNTYNGKQNNLNVLSVEKPVKVVGDLTGSQIGLSDPTLWDDNKEDTASDAVSTARLTDGYKANNDSLVPADAFTSDHESWYVDFGEKKTEQGAEIGRTYTYTARKYNAVSRTTGSQAARGTLVDVVAKTTFSQGGRASNTTELYNELTTRYKEEYQEIDTDNYYDPVSGSNIEVYPYGYNIYVYVDNNTLFAGASYQQYVDEGHFALVFLGGTLDNAEFSDDYTEETVVLDEPIDNDETEYDFNDIGHTVSKTVILKNSEDVDIQYDTITTDYTSEVRLVRRTAPIKFHDNKDKVNEGEDKLFRVYNPESGETYDTENGTHELNAKYQISAFYDIPKFAEDDYVFAGWYTTSDNSDNSASKAFKFDSDIPSSVTDVYAHWIAVGEVSKDGNDDKILPASMNDKYSGFGLFGVQIRPEAQFDQNLGEYYHGGLRFVASVGEDLLSDIDALSDKTVDGNKVEYGFVTAGESTVNTVANDSSFNIDNSKYKIQYKGTNVNGVNTTVKERSANNFNYVTNLDCTSKTPGKGGKVYGNNSKITIDHRNYSDYRLATYVVTYEDDQSGANKDKNVVARAYMRYYDANGLLRTFYNDYGGTCVYGGCSISYNGAKEMAATNENTAH